MRLGRIVRPCTSPRSRSPGKAAQDEKSFAACDDIIPEATLDGLADTMFDHFVESVSNFLEDASGKVEAACRRHTDAAVHAILAQARECNENRSGGGPSGPAGAGGERGLINGGPRTPSTLAIVALVKDALAALKADAQTAQAELRSVNVLVRKALDCMQMHENSRRAELRTGMLGHFEPMLRVSLAAGILLLLANCCLQNGQLLTFPD
jgi:hypothetical protein